MWSSTWKEELKQKLKKNGFKNCEKYCVCNDYVSSLYFGVRHNCKIVLRCKNLNRNGPCFTQFSRLWNKNFPFSTWSK